MRAIRGLLVIFTAAAGAGCGVILGLDPGEPRDGDASVDATGDTSPLPQPDQIAPPIDAQGDGFVGPDAISGDGGVVPPTCPANTKLCKDQCVPLDDAATGCNAPTCDPCEFPNAEGVCAPTKNSCTIGTCEAPYGNCDNDASNGCEVDLSSSTQRCGHCNVACDAGSSCVDGGCVLGCQPPTVKCGAGLTCINLKTDVNHCGSCTSPCDAGGPNTNVNCYDGGCVYNCNSGSTSSQFQQCTGSWKDGCTNTFTDPAHCGSCSVQCNNPFLAAPPNMHHTGACQGGSCTLACNTGYVDCNGTPSDGCECGPAGTKVCSSGTCFGIAGDGGIDGGGTTDGGTINDGGTGISDGPMMVEGGAVIDTG